MNDMTNEQRETVLVFRDKGMSYQSIARFLGLPTSTVKSWHARYMQEKIEKDKCRFCGAPIVQTPHKKQKKFCSDTCRYRWWNAHPEFRKAKKRRNGRFTGKEKEDR